MEHYASEQEQVEALKRWWKDNGRPLVFGLAIGIAALAGYRYWDAMQTARAEDASQNYSAMLQMMNDQRIDDARTTGQAIIDTYPDSTYARLSALLLAKLAADTEDYARARELLTPLVEGAGDSEVAPLARARLAPHQHRDVSARDLRQIAEERLHGLRAREHAPTLAGAVAERARADVDLLAEHEQPTVAPFERRRAHPKASRLSVEPEARQAGGRRAALRERFGDRSLHAFAAEQTRRGHPELERSGQCFGAFRPRDHP